MPAGQHRRDNARLWRAISASAAEALDTSRLLCFRNIRLKRFLASSLEYYFPFRRHIWIEKMLRPILITLLPNKQTRECQECLIAFVSRRYYFFSTFSIEGYHATLRLILYPFILRTYRYRAGCIYRGLSRFLPAMPGSTRCLHISFPVLVSKVRYCHRLHIQSVIYHNSISAFHAGADGYYAADEVSR